MRCFYVVQKQKGVADAMIKARLPISESYSSLSVIELPLILELTDRQNRLKPPELLLPDDILMAMPKAKH